MAKDDKMIMALIMALIVAGVDGCASNAGIASLHESGWNYIIHQADKKIAKIIKFKSYIGHEIKISHEKPPSKLPKSPKNKPQFFGKKKSVILGEGCIFFQWSMFTKFTSKIWHFSGKKHGVFISSLEFLRKLTSSQNGIILMGGSMGKRCRKWAVCVST